MKVRRVALVWLLLMLFTAAANAQSREHVVCYSAKGLKKACSSAATNAGAVCEEDLNCPGGLCESQPKLPKGLLAKLDDDTDPTSVGEDKTFEVKKVKQVCVPIDKNGEGVDDPNVFWVTYQLKQAGAVCTAGTNLNQPCKDGVEDCGGGTCTLVPKFDKKAARNINVFVEDQYTNIRVNAGKVDMLMVPATLCDGDNDAACVSGANAEPGAGVEEHYKCYKAGATKKVCAAGNANEFEACDDDSQCANSPGACVGLAKFAKGQSAVVNDNSPGLNLDRTFDVAKLTHVCKAVAKTVLPGGSPEGPVNPNALMLCYKSKGSAGHCAGGIATGAPCKDNDVCPNSTCTLQAKFDKDDPDTKGMYVNDQFDISPLSGPTQIGDYHRLNLAKEEMVCMPACENPDQNLTFTDDVVRAATLMIPPTGNPGQGQDVDGDNLTCRPNPPSGCSGGIDNEIGKIAAFLPAINTALQDSVTNGTINIVLELSNFANGNSLANGYIGTLDTPAGCTDQNDGIQICNYTVETGVNHKTCLQQAPVEVPITISGLPGTPATIVSAGSGTDLTFNLPFGDAPVEVTAHKVKVGASVVHSSGTISTASGTLGGALNQRELKNTILSLPDGMCVGGADDGNSCTDPADCDTNNCNLNYLAGLDKNTAAGLPEIFLVRDIDLDGLKTCEGGNNAGTVCTVDTDCPDQAAPSPICDQFDAHSIGIQFTAIDAAISAISLGCDKATCSLY